MKPMLAHSIELAQLTAYCDDDNWTASQKVDGIRIGIVTGGGRVQALNRKGEPTCKDVSRDVLEAFASLRDVPCVFDGEYVQQTRTFHVFDMPSVDDEYDVRRMTLEAFFAAWGDECPRCVRLLPIARTSSAKRALALRLLDANAEGLMFNMRRARYEPGKRSRYVLKAKFVKDIDCVVTDVAINGKANMQLSVYDGDTLRAIGECTALAGDGARIKRGDVVTVRYLYAADPAAPRIYQPTLPRLRDDKAARECTLDQLKFTSRDVLAAHEFTQGE